MFRIKRSVWLDAGLAVLVVVVQLWPYVSRTNPSGGPWHWWGYGVVMASALPLLLRHRFPVVALLASLVAMSSYDLFGDVPAQPVWYSPLVLLYTVAVASPQWPRQIMLAGTVLGSFVIGSSETGLRSGIMFVAAYAIGRAAATSRAHARQLEIERRIEAERAAERERARIARDMHDILSHAVSLMVVQAEAGPVALGRDPAKAEAAFDAIAAAGRDAMVQLRRILNVLKENDEPHAPQPTLNDLPALVGNAPLAVSYAVSGEPRAVSSDVQLAAYRITQEAITNIVKHASATQADVTLRWQEHRLTLDITDNGSGGTPRPGGNGLIGIRERATACGGTATAGPRPSGTGFRVHVELPV